MMDMKTTSQFALEMQAKMSALQSENKLLKIKLKSYEESNARANFAIDEFVEKWYEENKDLVDIGEVQICGSYKVDLIPDEIEKRIYSKMLKIIYAFVSKGIL